jgi:hypothetical protein
VAKIDRVEELPEWFDLGKYRGCESFGAYEWHCCLDMRRGIFNLYNVQKMIGTENNILAPFFNKSSVMQELQQLRAQPLNLEAGNGALLSEDNHRKRLEKPIKNLMFSDLEHQFHCDEQDFISAGGDELLAERWRLITQGERYCPQPKLEGLQVAKVLGEYPILVDLSATDAVLKEAFATWLQVARSALKVDAPSALFYKRWDGYRILPYLDLWIWGLETNTQIIEGAFAAAIFPGLCDGMGRLKTTKKWAKSLMGSLSALEAQAAIESASLATQEILEG